MEKQEVQMLVWTSGVVTLWLVVAWGSYLLTPHSRVPETTTEQVLRVKVGSQVAEVVLWDWVKCHTNGKWDYIISVPNPSHVTIGNQRTDVNIQSAWFYISEVTAGKALTARIWDSPADICKSYANSFANVVAGYVFDQRNKKI